MSTIMIKVWNNRRNLNWHTANGSASFHMPCRFTSCECLIPRWDNPDWQKLLKFENLLSILIPSHSALSLEEISPDKGWVSDAEPKIPYVTHWQRLSTYISHSNPTTQHHQIKSYFD
jgi:hypothetical protein